jgi:hypothetical protein
LEKEKAATVANSKGVNNDWTTNKGCNFFCLTLLLSWKKGKRKEGTRPWRRNKLLLQWGYPVLRVQARNKAKRNHKLADPNSYTCVSRSINTFAGLHVHHWVLKNKTGNPSLQGSAGDGS